MTALSAPTSSSKPIHHSKETTRPKALTDLVSKIGSRRSASCPIIKAELEETNDSAGCYGPKGENGSDRAARSPKTTLHVKEEIVSMTLTYRLISYDINKCVYIYNLGYWISGSQLPSRIYLNLYILVFRVQVLTLLVFLEGFLWISDRCHQTSLQLCSWLECYLQWTYLLP